MSGDPAHLHVYGQEAWHDEAFVVGDVAGLTALRDAIDAALRDGAAVTPVVFVNDGEGYQVVVAAVPDMSGVAVPYHDEFARHGSAGTMLPVLPVLPWRLEGVARLLKERDETGGAT